MKHSVRSLGFGAPAVVAALTFATLDAHALSLGLDTNAVYSDGAGGGSSDPDSLFLPVPAPGSVSSSTLGGVGDFSTGPGIAPGADAGLNALGFSHTRVNNVFASPPPLPPTPAHTMYAESVFTQTETNNSGGARDYALNLFLKNMSLGLVNYCGSCFSNPGGNPFDNPAFDPIGASIEYSVTVDGALLFMARADLFGTALGGVHVLAQTHTQDGTAPDGTTVNGTLNVASVGPAAPTPNSVAVTFDDLFGTLDVGTFADGQSFTVVATMRATVTSNPFEMGGFAYIGDPNVLDGEAQTTLLVSDATTPVPEAGALALFGLGIAGLGLSMRRRRR